MPTQAPPFVSRSTYPTAGTGYAAVLPLQSSSVTNVIASGAGCPLPVEPSAVVPEISRKLGATAWKQVVRDWEYPDPSRNHHTALEHWKHEWHASNRQSQLWGQRRTIAWLLSDLGETKPHSLGRTQNIRMASRLSCTRSGSKGRRKAKFSAATAARVHFQQHNYYSYT